MIKKREKELSCDLIENRTLCNTSKEMALFEDKEENIEKIDHGIGNSPLVDIFYAILKDEEKVPILRPDINITNNCSYWYC